MKVKRGFREVGKPKVCGISFDLHPLWLWTLRPSEWSEIWISVETDIRLKETHRETWNRHSHLIQTYREGTNNGHAVSSADVWWISGTKRFVEVALSRKGPCRSVSCLTRSPRRTPASTEKGGKWYSLCHQSIGSVTNARGIFFLMGFEALNLSADLPQTLAHVLKHGIRGTPCRKDDEEPHYTPSDSISMRQSGRPVVYESYFSATGWCKRSLDESELCLALELPEFVDWDWSWG